MKLFNTLSKSQKFEIHYGIILMLILLPFAIFDICKGTEMDKEISFLGTCEEFFIVYFIKDAHNYIIDMIDKFKRSGIEEVKAEDEHHFIFYINMFFDFFIFAPYIMAELFGHVSEAHNYALIAFIVIIVLKLFAIEMIDVTVGEIVKKMNGKDEFGFRGLNTFKGEQEG